MREKILNPHIDSFIEEIRTPKEKDPFLLELDEKARQITNKVIELRNERQDLVKRYPLLDVNANDQFSLTPYDNLQNVDVHIPDETHLRSWEIQRDENLMIANHPARLFAMNELEQRGFIPPPKIRTPRKKTQVLEKSIREKEILWLSDLGQSRQLTLDKKHANHPQVHRTPFLAVGPLSFVGERARSFIGVGAMFDITGSVLAGVTLSKMHVLWHVPKDGKFADPKVQSKFVREIITQLNNLDDPLLAGYTREEKKQIIDRWISCMVISTEADSQKALRRFDLAYSEGGKSARPYQHTAGIEVVDTTRSLRKEFPDVELFASQISSEYIAQACEEAGASADIIGVGSGATCDTARMAALIPTNAHLPWALRGKLNIPIIGEGGAVNNPVVSALVGMSGVLGSGSLGGGTFEAPGGMFYFTRDGGKTLYKPYRGEASPASKHLSGKTYPSGTSYFDEGKVDERMFNPFRPSITTNIRKEWEAVIVGAADLGLNGDDPDIIGQMHRIKPSPLFRITQAGSIVQKTH